MGLCESGIDCADANTDKDTMKEKLESEAGSIEEYAMSDSPNDILSQIHFEIKEMRAEISQSISLLLSQKSPTAATSHTPQSSNQYTAATPHSSNQYTQRRVNINLNGSSSNTHNSHNNHHIHPGHHRYHSSGSSIGSLNLNFDDNASINIENDSNDKHNISRPILTPVCSEWDSSTCKIILEHQDPIKQ